MKATKKLFALAMVILMIFALSGCGASRLVGQWRLEDYEHGYLADYITFNKDHTGTCDGLEMNWSTKGKTLRISTWFLDDEYRYSVSGNKLKLVEYYDGKTDGTEVYEKIGGAPDTGRIITWLLVICVVILLVLAKRTGRLEKLALREKAQRVLDNVKKSDESKEKRKCSNCGALVDKDAAFCTNCGSQIAASKPSEKEPPKPTNKCPNCGQPVQDKARFCSNCGCSLEKPPVVDPPKGTKSCPKCGKTVGISTRFCTNCGYDFNPSKPKPPKGLTPPDPLD